MPIFFPPAVAVPDSAGFNTVLVESGAYVPSAPIGVSRADEPVSNDQIDLVAFFPIKGFTCDQIAFQNSSVASGQAKVLIYDADGEGKPQNRQYQSAPIDISAGGLQLHSVSFTFSAFNVYWIGIHNSLATLFKSPTAGAINLPSTGGLFSTGARSGISTSEPFANDAPDPWTFSAGTVVGPGLAFYFRVA